LIAGGALFRALPVTPRTIRNPKRIPASDGWYRYYAGYSSSFVEDALDDIAESLDGPILDPWNGAGTTTAVANDRGLLSRGFDLNPVLVLVAKGRLVEQEHLSATVSLGQLLARDAANQAPGSVEPEGLAIWFERPTAQRLRGLEASIRRNLVGEGDLLADRSSLMNVSALASFYYVALSKWFGKP
jgi:hypothetical protein